MQAAVEALVEQYESELSTLREMNQSTINELGARLDEAILDKEEIADGYLIEIERLELALNEAVTQLSEQGEQKAKGFQRTREKTTVKTHYRSLDQKLSIRNSKFDKT